MNVTKKPVMYVMIILVFINAGETSDKCMCTATNYIKEVFMSLIEEFSK